MVSLWLDDSCINMYIYMTYLGRLGTLGNPLLLLHWGRLRPHFLNLQRDLLLIAIELPDQRDKLRLPGRGAHLLKFARYFSVRAGTA